MQTNLISLIYSVSTLYASIKKNYTYSGRCYLKMKYLLILILFWHLFKNKNTRHIISAYQPNGRLEQYLGGRRQLKLQTKKYMLIRGFDVTK